MLPHPGQRTPPMCHTRLRSALSRTILVLAAMVVWAGVGLAQGTGIVVKTASGVKSVKQLGGATICVLPGTTTELDLADWARAEGIAYTPVLIGSLNEIRQAFLSGRCDGYTTDSSQAAGFRYMQ